MELEVFVLCDAATDSQGKLNILGAFDTILAPSLPAVHPQCAMVARVRFSTSEGGEHSFKLTLNEGSGKSLLPPFEVKAQVHFEQPDKPSRLNIIVSVGGLKLESYGLHTALLEIDGAAIATSPFLVSKPIGSVGAAAH